MSEIVIFDDILCNISVGSCCFCYVNSMVVVRYVVMVDVYLLRGFYVYSIISMGYIGFWNITIVGIEYLYGCIGMGYVLVCDVYVFTVENDDLSCSVVYEFIDFIF